MMGSSRLLPGFPLRLLALTVAAVWVVTIAAAAQGSGAVKTMRYHFGDDPQLYEVGPQLRRLVASSIAMRLHESSRGGSRGGRTMDGHRRSRNCNSHACSGYERTYSGSSSRRCN
jgi:hypothetical protein